MKQGVGLLAAVLILVGVAGCGEEFPEVDAADSAATELTRFLPADGDSYTSTDVAAIKRRWGFRPKRA